MTRSRSIRTWLGAVATAFVALAVVFGFVNAATGSAAADVNPQIKIENLSWQKTDISGKVHPDQTMLRRWQFMTASFDWNGTAANLKAGDQFRIEIPKDSAFKIWEGQTKNLEVDYDGGKVSIGTCTLTSSAVDCVFDQKVDELRAQGFSEFRGSGSVLLEAYKATDVGTLTFTVNGEEKVLKVPGGKVGVWPFQKSEFYKWANGLTKESNRIYWHIEFGTAYVAKKLNEAGSKVVFDGNQRSTLVFEDTLEDGHTFVQDPSKWLLVLRDQDQSTVGRWEALVRGDGSDVSTKYGDYDMSVTYPASNQVRIEVTGPWQSDVNMRLSYESQPTTDNGLIDQNHTYRNAVRLLQTDVVSSNSIKYSSTFDINARMAPGFGSLKFVKNVTGNAADKVPADQQYSLNLRYVLPGGATASVYEGWKVPGTLDADGTGGNVNVKVTKDSPLDLTDTFPVGTTVTITEEAPAATDDYTWNAPVIKIDGKDATSVVIKDQVRAEVQLTNETVAKPKPTPTPTPTPSATPSATPTPSVTPSAPAPVPSTTPSAPAPQPSGKPKLPKTGADAVTFGVLATAAVAGGALLLGVARRRKRA
ncbi:LPXTG cell wall anchor domain-containing protein [Buchananella hordeovulneris]|uniref:DUF7926 domain-containing protein n=1 Tax=Buchananella hordeovulneris TaxID=52770 RepID=UPI000F5FEC98|nr:DUF5979 domain-containing protein [Buchananella hordeovulneris]RRD49801.1 LPXTG cell wall anchor domain-containing protein [Buchananella hordeovulneris]